MARESKVMWSARLPSELVEQIKLAAEEEGLSEADLVAPYIAEGLDQRNLGNG